MVSRLSGMVRLMVFAFAIGGRTVLADAYQLAYLIPSTIYEFIVGGLLSAVFIPILVREQEKTGKSSAETWYVANLLLGGVGLLLTAAGLIGLLGAPWIIEAMTELGDDDATAAAKQLLATNLFRWFTPQILLLGINAVFMAILNSLGVFAVTAAAPIMNNVVVISCFLAYYFDWIDVSGLAVGTTLGTASMILVQLPWLWKAGMKIRPTFNLRHPIFKSVTDLGWPIALVSLANLVGWGIRSNLLSTELGAFAIYTLCFQIIMMPYGIFAVSIATVLYPSLSRHVANKRRDAFISDMALGFRWSTFILLPISLGIAVLSMPIVRVLFEHRGGQFTFSDSLFTGSFLGYYALSIAPYGLVMFATRVFYSMNDTKTPAAINVAGVVVNSIISYFLLTIMGANGIAVGATVTYSLTTAISMVLIRRETGGLGGSTVWIPLIKMTGAGALMALAVCATELATRPDLIVMERGTRLRLPVPTASAAGNLSVIHSAEEYRRVWVALGRHAETTPKIDFSKNSVALVWGPRSRTTSTLEIVTDRTDISETSFTLNANVRALVDTLTTSSESTADLPTSPAYALIQIRKPDANARLGLTVISADEEGSNQSNLIKPELLRLILLISLGAAVYIITAFLFRIEELELVINKILRKLKRRRE